MLQLFDIKKNRLLRYAEILFISVCFAYTDVHRASSQTPEVAEPKGIYEPSTGEPSR